MPPNHRNTSAPAQPPDPGEDRPVDPHAPEVPPGVRQAVLALMRPGDQLWRCPRISGRRGFLGLRAGVHIVEWWLVDAQGDLIEAFWAED